ncbi:MAG: DNA mismatch repair endonuclease MutL [Clostridia bacterium]|nr:DNA mismatch repair endonuclease MutL [Clostridia bacterium]
MGNIVLLDDLTINKIAAGEVIERPASVVKEVVENSIDAGADNISVEIRNGGISYIRITDNGKGIAADDLEIAFERHATSKIRHAEDLETVKSMGFRGEALASIAAIARVELVSKTEDSEIGHRIVVEGGKVIIKEETGCPKGTTITIENLFYNTPVRYKFLKKDFTESGYIEDAITRIALVNPNIAIKFINSGKTVIQTSGNGNIKDIVYKIYGKDIAENLIDVDYSFEDMNVKGVIGKPSIARSNRSNQLFFVNKRYVKDKTLTSAAEQSFKGTLPIGKYGFLILNIEIDPHKLDVNVHPAKLEVRFQEENMVFKLVYHAIQEALSKIENSEQKVNESSSIYSDEIEKIENRVIENVKVEEKEDKYDTKGFGGFLKNILGSKNEFQTNNENVVEQLYNDKIHQEKEELLNSIYNETNTTVEEVKTKFDNINVNDDGKIEIKSSKTEENDEKPAATSNLEKLVKELDANLEKLNLKPQVPNSEILSQIVGEEKNENTEDLVNETVEPLVSNETKEFDLREELKLFNQEEAKLEEAKKEEIKEEDKQEDKDPDVKFEEMYEKMFGTTISKREPETEEEKVCSVKQEDLKTVENVSLFSNESKFDRPIYKYIGIVFDSYIVIEYEKEMYIVDQRSAQERIIYEKVKKNYLSDTDKDAQLMLLPDVINLTDKEMDIAKENLDLFRKAGFELDEFGDKTIKLSGVPNICMDLDTRQLFIEILEEINKVDRTNIDEKADKFIATIASKVAIKSPYALTAQEVDKLMVQLLSLPQPFVSPNGYPTAIRMSKIDIEKKFSRR